MTQQNTGGPAFPNSAFGGTRNEQQGMTLRDYFAAKAMAIVMTPVLEEIRKCNISDADVIKLKQVSADACYEMADAMLKAREQ